MHKSRSAQVVDYKLWCKRDGWPILALWRKPAQSPSMKIKATLIALSLSLASCSNTAETTENTAQDEKPVESTMVDVPRDTTPIDEKQSLTTTTAADGSTMEGYGTSQLSDALLKIGVIVYMEATTVAYKANGLKETDQFEGLGRYLSDSKDSWVSGVAAAVSKGILPADAIFTVNGTDFRELQAGSLNVAEGIVLGLTLRGVTCEMAGTFVEQVDLNMEFAWAAPSCKATGNQG